MKNLCITFFCMLAVLTVQSQDEDYNILFIGNSYVFSNDLPNMLEQIAVAKGNSAITAQSTPGGYTLQQHTLNANTQELLQNGSWDFVIMQEQSQMPAFPDNQVQTDVYPYAKQLVDTARAYNDCVMPMFFMTWGRIEGDQDNCASWPPVCTYEGQQDLLSERYQEMAHTNDCWVGPVGEAWRQVREDTDDAIQLYSNDGSH
ncbi:MAG: hypothetical protein AAF391_13255, partial [Bacteroidota bacterium]